MMKYIKSSANPLERRHAKETEIQTIQPVVDEILSRYSETTGLICTLTKYYIRADLNSVLLTFAQDINYGYHYLVTYSRPGAANLSNPAMISIDASDAEIDEFVSNMIDSLVGELDNQFNSKYTRMQNPEAQIDRILEEIDMCNAVYDESIARQFISELLESGEISNPTF